MANEIYEYAGMSVTKAGANVVNATVNVTSTLAGDATIQGYMSVPHTYLGDGSVTPLPITALTTCGMLFIRNLDSTNTVTVASSGTSSVTFAAAKLCDIPAGGFAIFRPPGAIKALYVLAANAACDIEYAAREP